MNEGVLFSIIIPVYNASAFIIRCLDSIYSQLINNAIFEVICVDDCSSDHSVNLIDGYTYEQSRPHNLYLIKHDTNKKRGGACNTGLLKACGEWILYIDSDDYFLEKKLKELSTFLVNNSHLDMVLFNYQSTNKEKCIEGIDTKELSGQKLIQSIPIPWISWCYAYKRSLLTNNKILYAENVFFEDADFVFRAVMKASLVRYVDLNVLFYNIYENQTSKVRDIKKLDDLFKLSDRLKYVSNNINYKYPVCAKIVLKHHQFLYKTILKRYLWRYSSIDMRNFLLKYKISDQTSFFDYTYFISKNPYVYVGPIIILRPLLLFLTKNKYK